MRSFMRGAFIVLIGLGAAFGVFRALGWPSTLHGPETSRVGFNDVKAGELLHAGLGPFSVVGNKEIKIQSIRLVGSLTGIELVAVRVDLAGRVGALRGEDPEIDRLPPASGYVLRPGDRGRLVVTFRVTSPGIYGFRGVRVGYRSGWLTRTKVIGPGVDVVLPSSSPSPSPTPTG